MRFLFCFLFVFGVFELQAQTTACKCCTEQHKAFDFWIGSWDVTNPDGTPAGKNQIVKEEGGCVLRENWTSATVGYTGTSLNFYNVNDQQWEQLWIDNSGVSLKLKGKKVNNQIVLTSDEFTGKDGKKYRNRITWTDNEDGTVRQLWELLEGEVVSSVAFDGLYKRIEE